MKVSFRTAKRDHPCWLGLAVCTLLLCPRSASAQPQADVAVMVETRGEVPAALAERCDEALVRALAEVANIHDPSLSAVAYGEVQLAVGCADSSPQCLARIARVAEVDALVIRTLSFDGSGVVVLQLLYFEEAASAPPVQVQMATTHDRTFELQAAMPRLVRRLLGIAEPDSSPALSTSPATVPPAEPSPSRGADPRAASHEAGGTVSLLTWVTLAVGAAGLATGVGQWISAHADYVALERERVHTAADADRIHREFADIESRTLLANVAAPVGAVALGIGLTLLVFDLSEDGGPEAARARVQVSPVSGGAMLSVRGAFDGAR